MKLTAQLRLPIFAFVGLMFLGDFRVIAADAVDDVSDDETWDYHLEDIDGTATFEFTNKKLTIELLGKSLGFGNVSEGGLPVVGEGVGETNSVRTTFRWSSRYERGVLTLDLDGHEMRVENQGKTLHVGGKKIQVDGKRRVKVTVRADGTVVVTPKEAILP